MILQNNTKKSFIFYLMLYNVVAFSIILASEKYNSILVFDKQPLIEIINVVKNLRIDEKNFVEKRNNFTSLLQNFFTELKRSSHHVSNKENLWLLFDLPNITYILTPLIYFYYQRDCKLTDVFIDNTNSLFDCIADEKSKMDAKNCAFLLMQQKIQYVEKAWVVWNVDIKKSFFHLPEGQIHFKDNNNHWYNILENISYISVIQNQNLNLLLQDQSKAQTTNTQYNNYESKLPKSTWQIYINNNTIDFCNGIQEDNFNDQAVTYRQTFLLN